MSQLLSPSEAVKLPLEKQFQHRLITIVASLPDEVRATIQKKQSGKVQNFQQTSGDELKAVLGQETPFHAKEFSDQLAQYHVLRAILGNDVIGGKVNEAAKIAFLEMGALASSAMATHPLLKDVVNEHMQFDWESCNAHWPSPPVCQQLVEYLAPYLAAVLVADEQYYPGIEYAFWSNNMVSLEADLRRYFETCLCDTDASLVLRDGLQHIEGEPGNRNALFKFCFPIYIGMYLEKSIIEYLSILIIARLRAKRASITFSAVTAGITRTIEGKFRM